MGVCNRQEIICMDFYEELSIMILSFVSREVQIYYF